ncbi:unnamed protein product, partial [Rotaria socialis]
AIIEHTNQVIFMEDDDLAVVKNGALTIHRTQHEVTGNSDNSSSNCRVATAE